MRFGARIPLLPAPADARTNPHSYVNDREGRRLAEAEDLRAYAAERAAWNLTWKPLRRAQLVDQRDRERTRRDESRSELAEIRRVLREHGRDRVDLVVGGALAQTIETAEKRRLREISRGEREELRTRPFAQAPPVFRRWKEARELAPPDPCRISGSGGAASQPGTLIGDLLVCEGLAPDSAEWWRGSRRVVVDAGRELALCDPAALPQALDVGAVRWGGAVAIGGPQMFRDRAELVARERALQYRFLGRQEAIALPSMPELLEPRVTRLAAALEAHLGPLRVNGRRFDSRRPDDALEQIPEPVEIAFEHAIAIAATPEQRARIERDGLTPALVAGDDLVFALDRSTSARERTAIAQTLRDLYGVRPAPGIVPERLRYGPAAPAAPMHAMLAQLRPAQAKIDFTARLQAIREFLEGLTPGPAIAVAPRPPGPPRPVVPTRTRSRGGRSL